MGRPSFLGHTPTASSDSVTDLAAHSYRARDALVHHTCNELIVLEQCGVRTVNARMGPEDAESAAAIWRTFDAHAYLPVVTFGTTQT
jgi:hypothetical protein